MIMKKIIFVTSKIEGGGSENVLNIISESLARSGYNVAIIILNDKAKKKCSEEKINNIYFDKKPIPNKLLSNFRKIIFIRNIVKSIKPHIIFSFITETNILVIISNLLLGNKLVISERNDIEKQKKKKIWKLLLYITYRFPDIITANSRKTVELLQNSFPKQNVQYIPNPIKKIKKLKIKKKKIILCVAKFENQKAHDILIRGFKISNLYKEGWRLVLIGEGSLKEKVISEVKTLGISSSVTFKPYSTNLSRDMSQAFLLVLPSRYEGMPNIILESALFKIPFLVSDSCEEVIKIFGKKNVELFKNNNTRSLKNKLLEITSKKTTILKVQKNYEVVEKKFNINNILDFWQKLIQH